MNNRIIVIDEMTQSHKDGRMIGNILVENMMTMCYRGSKALHEMRGRENFEIKCVLDAYGNSAPTGKSRQCPCGAKDGPNKFSKQELDCHQ